MADVRKYADIIRQANSGETVRDAIISCIQEINADAAVKSKNLLITSSDNKTYRAGTGFAFKNVTVNIDNEGESDPNKSYKLEELEITTADIGEPKTYPDPPDDNLVYNKVFVNVDWSTLGSQFNLGEQATITQVKGPDDSGLKYWDADLAGYDYVKRVYFDPSAGIKLPDYPGTGGSSGPFTVTFKDFDGKSKASVPNILYGHDAHEYMSQDVLDIVRKIENDSRFSSWSPSVSSVTGNYTVSPVVVKRGVGGSLEDYSWEEIMSMQNQLEIGSTAVMRSPAIDLPAVNIYNKAPISYQGGQAHITINMPAHSYAYGYITFKCMVVAHGEGGTNTTWLATTRLSKRVSAIVNEVGGTNVGGYGLAAETTGCDDATSSIIYQFLNSYVSLFFDSAITLTEDRTKKNWGLPSYDISISDIRNAGGNMNAYYLTKKTGAAGKIWVPSITELGSLCTSASVNKYSGWDQDERITGWHSPTNDNANDSVFAITENSANDYGSIWRPEDAPTSGELHIMTRSLWLGTMRGNVYAGPTIRNVAWINGHYFNDTTDPQSNSVIQVNTGEWDLNNLYIGFNT